LNPAASQLEIHSLATAPWHVLVHLAFALLAVVLGTAVLLRRKGDLAHKALGWSWVCLMLAIALTSFFIQARGYFSLIHILSVVVLITVPLGVVHIRRGRVRAHRYTMISVFAGLVIAGAFTLLPYRMLGQLIFAAR
jgi:uncharacterized membrane protein